MLHRLATALGVPSGSPTSPSSSFSLSSRRGGGVDDEKEQVERSQVAGSIWNAVLRADRALVEQLLQEDPAVLDQRGAVGELPIHMMLLYNTPAHRELARWSLLRAPHLRTAVYTGREYAGENLLHIAIINQCEDTVRELLDYDETTTRTLLQGRATGTFFRPGSACAYGETPLAFALCTSQLHIAQLLLDAGADLECTDAQGNTLLHLAVRHNLADVYSFVKNEWKHRQLVQKQREKMQQQEAGGATPAAPAPSAVTAAPSVTPLWLRTNHAGLTPFCLSAKSNASEMFTFLLEESKQIQWTFGSVSCVLYPLKELDLTISKEAASEVDAKAKGAAGGGASDAPVACKEHPGALELIMNAGNVDLLMHPRLLDLVSQKWNTFAKRIFQQRFRVVLMYLALFTLTTIIRQSVQNIARAEAAAQAELAAIGAEESPEVQLQRHEQYIPWALWLYHFPLPVRLLGLCVLVGAAWKGSKELDEVSRAGVREYFSASGSALLENLLSCTYCACMFLVFLLNVFGYSSLEGPVLAVASIALAGYLFFFLLAFKLTGPLVVIISRMLSTDVARFLLIYSVFLAGFASAFFVLFESEGGGGLLDAIKTCFTAMLGQFDLEQFSSSRYAAVCVSLLVVYVVTCSILLLNLLIATMGSTFELINESSEKQWHLERARIIFAIEREMTSEERHKGENKYWTTVNGERFLQVLEINPDHFQKDPGAAAFEAAAAEKQAA